MYLGMSEDDYQNVQKSTPKIVAKRLGLADDLTSEDLEMEINAKDHIAFLIMNEFRLIYEKWWALSKSFSSDAPPKRLTNLKVWFFQETRYGIR